MQPATSSDSSHTGGDTAPTLKGVTHADFIGIGGCGMSGLARLFHSLGITCSGSDATRSTVTTALQAEGLSVRTNQDGSELPETADLVIMSAAIPADAARLYYLGQS